MSDTPEIPETAPPALAPADAPAPRPEPSVADTARLLAEHFPALFGAGVVKPIKLRIHADIQQRAPGVFTKKALSLFLQRHTTATAYLRALVAEGATRTDLDGQPAGEIAAEHRDAAGVELERRRAIVEAKKQAAREAARAARPARPDPAPRRPRPARAGEPQGPGRPREAGAAAPRRPHKPRPEREPARNREPAPAHAPAQAPALPLTPEQSAEAAARQQRAMLLRSFEQSTLSKANFCALKGLNEDALDALLTQARQERGSR